jgi:replicative DNA helicase
MRLSAPIYQLKRRARHLARNRGIALHEALDQVAREEGFAGWSLLAARTGLNLPSKALLSRLSDGDMLLIGARPGHGKTLLGLQLLIDAARAGRKAVLFSLELTDREARGHLLTLENGSDRSGEPVDIVTSDNISADYIIRHLSSSKPGTLAIVDYLQVLDQKRINPALPDQMLALRAFARASGVVLGFISQIDRSFDPKGKGVPDMLDLRLPNPVHAATFSKACFLHDGEFRLQEVA